MDAQAFERRQSPSPPTTHAPPAAVQRPLPVHSSVPTQSVLAVAAHIPACA